MRISYWSSDVCSSDLYPSPEQHRGQADLADLPPEHRADDICRRLLRAAHQGAPGEIHRGQYRRQSTPKGRDCMRHTVVAATRCGYQRGDTELRETYRSEKRRVGKECDSPCKTR